MHKVINTYSHCSVRCQKLKIQRHTHIPYKNFEIPSERFQFIHLDLVSTLLPHGFTYIVDRFSCWVEAIIPLSNITAEIVAEAEKTV